MILNDNERLCYRCYEGGHQCIYLSVGEEAQLPETLRDSETFAQNSNYQHSTPTEASTIHTSPQPILVVIDGLDECDSTVVQCDILRSTANAINTNHLTVRLRFLITSRPEPHIRSLLDGGHFQHLCYQYSLDQLEIVTDSDPLSSLTSVV